jgi:hypothetical protein
MSALLKPCLSSELSTAALGDPRRTARLCWLVKQLSERPGFSLPQTLGSDSELEAAYRFLGSKGVEPSAIMAPHVAATVERCASYETVYAVSDTSEFCFGGEEERAGLGYLQGNRRGFHGHMTLAVAGDGSRCPLGVLAWDTIVRGPVPKQRRGGGERAEDPHRESKKWQEGALKAEQALASPAAVLHVMDREADAYDLLAWMCARGARFVIRVARDRKIDDDEFTRLFESLQGAPSVFSSQVSITARARAKANKQHPARTQRAARLQYAVARRIIPRPPTANSDGPSELTLNFVHITEPNPPADQEPVDWKLVTREPIETGQDVLNIVDAYRARWTIEEYFKAIKTGCAYEKAQLESLHSLLNYLATLLPVAWQLLALRNLGRDQPNEPASKLLTPLQLEVLAAMATRRPLPLNPTIEDAMLSIAGMGGHLKNNGAPGWQTLGRGFQDLVKYVAAWVAAKSTKTSDQS